MNTKITPPDLAQKWGVVVHKTHAWIRSGELRAIDTRRCLGGRSRYLIDLADLVAFEQKRAVTPLVPHKRRRSRCPQIKELF